MPLTTLVAYLLYDSGSHYRIGRESATDTIRLYWRDAGETPDWQCFVTYSALDDDGKRRSDADLVDTAKRLIVAHRLEPSSAGAVVRS